MSALHPTDINHPIFARLCRRNRQVAAQRGETEHRRRLLEDLAGRVVDVGAGDGGNFALYPSTVTEVVAIEPEPRLRAFAQAAACEAPVPIRVLPGLADALPLEDASVDAVVVSLVLCSVPDQAAALAEARRVLRANGEVRFYEHVIARRQPQRALLQLVDRTGLWPLLGGGCHPARDTGAAIREAGFTIERCERFAFSPNPSIPEIPHILGSARR
jgi:ubiquinone/menaquinone biosynthesis C-methylase UbiE